MATAGILSRTAKALGIVLRQELTPLDDLDGIYRVRDTGTGSGQDWLTSATFCDCPDRLNRGVVCKHMRAVIREQAALEAYAAEWDATVAAARPGSPSGRASRCPRCGAGLESMSFYVGGRGYVAFQLCSADHHHHSVPA